MNATRAGRLWSHPVDTISAPNRKNTPTCRTALTFSLNSLKAFGMSCSATPSATPATKAAISPLPYVTCARP